MNSQKIGTRHPWVDLLGNNLSDFVSESKRRHKVDRRRLGPYPYRVPGEEYSYTYLGRDSRLRYSSILANVKAV
jgi:hypothetical protein